MKEKDVIKLFGAGFLISFIGSLPPGTLNLTALSISLYHNITAALWFSFGAALVEVVIVYILFKQSDWLNLTTKLLNYLYPLAILLFLYLGIQNYLELHQVQSIENSLSLNSYSPFVFGLLLSFMNPIQIPFWITWQQVIKSKGFQLKSSKTILTLAIIIGVGTFVVLFLFAFGVSHIIAKLQDYQYYAKWTLVIVYIAFALFLSYQYLKIKFPKITIALKK